MTNLKFIEVDVQRRLEEDSFYKMYETHVFFTCEGYSHDKIVEIMKSIHQKYKMEECAIWSEIDFDDLCVQLGKHGIYQLTPVERYTFDIEED